jgi:oligosaccharide reducing-end xylanase
MDRGVRIDGIFRAYWNFHIVLQPFQNDESQMKKIFHLSLLVVALAGFCVGKSADNCTEDIQDIRGKMKPWEKGARNTGKCRNIFLESGYRQVDINAKLDKAYHDIFEGPDRVYFEVGDSMAYVSDLKNRDARTEGLSYGMMIAVQLNKKDVFDRLWRWTKKYMQHQGGARDAYFAWSVNPKTGKHNAEGSASDGELYFITDLLFASNRWGNNTGIDYYAEARKIIDAMWSKDGTEGITHLINTQHKLITFVPDSSGYGWTDPSYHVPAFYEVWAEYAKDGREQFYRECADASRAFLHRACNAPTALNVDATEFDGAPKKNGWFPNAFRFDSWRVPMNIAMDYSWFAKDRKWQQGYGRRIQNFLFCRGLDKFEDQFNVDGTLPESILPAGGYKKLRHSLGLVATSAAASIMGTQAKSWKFVDALWNAKLEPYPDGYFDPYYDGLLYLFSLMHLSGNYRIITPGMK